MLPGLKADNNCVAQALGGQQTTLAHAEVSFSIDTTSTTTPFPQNLQSVQVYDSSSNRCSVKASLCQSPYDTLVPFNSTAFIPLKRIIDISLGGLHKGKRYVYEAEI